MILEHAVIWTGDPACPWAEALGVDGSRIVAVGSAEAVRARLPDAERIDLDGSFLCPGLVDAHAHVIGLGRRAERVDLTGAVSLDACLVRIRKAEADRRERRETGWVQGRGWDQNDWPDVRFPSRSDLDRVLSDQPAAFTRIDGHALWVNTRALALAGLGPDTPDPPGGKIHRDPEGHPTGILVDRAMELVTGVIPEPGLEEDRESIRRAASLLVRSGITGVHDMGMTSAQAAVYRDLASRGELPVRILGAIYATVPDLAGVLARGADPIRDDERFRLGMVKFFMDGALGSRGAALLEPYADDPGNRGLLLSDPDTLRRTLQASLDAGFQCAVHAIGDRGNRVFLETWASLRRHRPGLASGPAVPPSPLSLIGEVPPERPAVRLEHAQILHPEDVARVGALGVVASMQPTHCTSDMPWAPDRLGPDRLAGAYAWRSVIQSGAVLAAGSDFPVEHHDPRFGLYAAVTRRAPGGTPAAGWSPKERLSRDEALAAFTAAPAYVAGNLHELGTLTPGKLADFVVFDRNLVTCDPESILEARVAWTVVGGRTEWIEPDWNPEAARVMSGAAPR